MSNQDCPGVPVAAIGEVGVLSVSGGYGAADTFSDDRIHAIRQGSCLVIVFRRRNVFKLLNPKVHRRYRKISFFEKATP